ncbi:MAG: hypothetical protein JXA58_00555, partial [Dehalococcoidia bacterium]|nr:hypothetical protein [Dehalococcoidia bacterium]
RELARKYAECASLGPCLAMNGCCGEERDLTVVDQTSDEMQHTHDVIAVRAVYSLERAEQIGRDVIVFQLRDRTSGAYSLWTYYWTRDRHGKWVDGRFPPLFSPEEAATVRTSIDDVQRMTRETERTR